MAQNSLLGDRIEQLTRHESLEADNFVGADVDPFGMGSGQADDAVPVLVECQKACNLGFFPAHDICRRQLLDA